MSGDTPQNAVVPLIDMGVEGISNELVSLYAQGLIGDPDRPTRASQAVDQAFEAIGGVNRLAIWADRNPTRFYTQMVAKRIPATAEISQKSEISIKIEWASPDRLSYKNKDVVDVPDA